MHAFGRPCAHASTSILEKHIEKGTNMVALISDCKPAIRAIEKLARGKEAPRSHIEARILHTLETRENNLQETYMAWVKGHKGIKGNVKADKLSKEASILGHESQGVVTPAGLRAWARRERKEARGGGGEGVLGCHHKAISAYTWCVTEKGPQVKWLHKIKKTDTPDCCQCHQGRMGRHLAEECKLLTEARGLVEKQEMRE